MVIKELKIDLKAKNSAITIRGRRDVLSSTVDGNWATLFKGRGMEFTGFRQYTYSDDASSIDWRASLRSKDTLVRVFEEFKNFNVYFYLDTSNSMLFTSGNQFKAEYAANVLFSLADEASRSGEAIGLGMFNDGMISNIQPTFGKGMHMRFEHLLTDKENYGGVRDFKKSMLQLVSTLTSRSIVILISDFIGLPSDWQRYMSMIATKHHIIGVMIRDQRDRHLPKSGQFAIKDPNSDETMYIDTAQYKDEYEKITREDEQRVIRTFKKLRSNCLVLENESDFVPQIKQFFNKLSHVEN